MSFNYGQKRPDGQYERHPILSEEERAKGFVRPVRRTYRHVGPKPPGSLRDLTSEEAERYKDQSYVKFEEYPKAKDPATRAIGKFWTQADLDRIGCDGVTSMPLAIAETYARKPDYYGSTFCAKCGDYFRVGAEGEFVWDGMDEKVGT